MSRIPEELIEQVRDSADLVEVVGETVNLKRTGSDYRGPCPFHGGTHRNFAVIPKRGLYYCFVCHAGGDVFTFLMKKFGMDYPSAVREVARRSGIVIPEATERAGPDPREPLYTAVSLAQDWYARYLAESDDAAPARRYLEEREFALEDVRPLGLGYAPPGKQFQEAMKVHDLADEVLLEAGLLVKRDSGQLIPRFRSRLLFPIHDLRGRVVGFGGRLLGPGEPKYLNSPETPIFRKGTMLYNLHQARPAVRKEECVLLVEGYFDVLRPVLAGVEHVVAGLGTSLTSDQAALLRRYTTNAVLVYDSDSAGQRATFRAADELLRHGVRVRVATLPDGEDPDSVVRKGGAEALESLVSDAVDVMERKIQLLDRRGWFGDVEHTREALDRLLPTIRAASDPITRDLYLGAVSEAAGVSRETLERELQRETRRGPPPAEAGPGAPPVREQAPVRARGTGVAAERELLRVAVSSPAWYERAMREVPPEWMEAGDTRELHLALTRAGTRDLPGHVLDSLSGSARSLWEQLREHPPVEEGGEAGDVYEGAREYLDARPHFRAYEQVLDQIRFAPEDERAALVVEQVRLRKELQERFPLAALKFLAGSVGKRLRQRSARSQRPPAPEGR